MLKWLPTLEEMKDAYHEEMQAHPVLMRCHVFLGVVSLLLCWFI